MFCCPHSSLVGPLRDRITSRMVPLNFSASTAFIPTHSSRCAVAWTPPGGAALTCQEQRAILLHLASRRGRCRFHAPDLSLIGSASAHGGEAAEDAEG